MSKYEKGDKVVMEITDKISVMGEPNYILSDAAVVNQGYIDKAAEPLCAYTEPLKDKIRRQAAEIIRLLAENKRLKAENGNSLWNIEQAKAEGQNEAWELALKLRYMDYEDKLECFGLKHDGEEKWVEIMENYTYQEAAAKVEAWEKAKEKPQKTMMQDFLEKYPKAYINPLGAPPICPHNLGYKKQNCVGDCLECWSRPLEQIGGESDA